MRSVKIAYLICMCIGQMLMLTAAILVPIYITPGHYWWTAFLIFLICGDGYVIGKRMNLWTGEV